MMFNKNGFPIDDNGVGCPCKECDDACCDWLGNYKGCPIYQEWKKKEKDPDEICDNCEHGDNYDSCPHCEETVLVCTQDENHLVVVSKDFTCDDFKWKWEE